MSLLSPELYAQLLARKNQKEEELNTAPAQAFTNGLLGGMQDQRQQTQQMSILKQQQQGQQDLTQQQDTAGMWKEMLSKYKFEKAVKDPQSGEINYQPFDLNDVNNVIQYAVKNKQLPDIFKNGSARAVPIQGDIQQQAELAGAKAGAVAAAKAPYTKSPLDAGALTPEAVEFATQQYVRTGQMPSLGMGNPGIRAQILNDAPKVAERLGLDVPGVMASRAGFKADSSSLSNISKQRDIVLAFENTANLNLDLAQQLSDKVSRTDIPLLNKAILSGEYSILGDPDVAKLASAVRTSINEYARVTSSVTGGGVTSDTARKEVEGMLQSAQTPEQFLGVIQTLKQEMENRREGYDTQISEIKSRITNKPQKTSPQKPSVTQAQPTPSSQAGNQGKNIPSKYKDGDTKIFGNTVYTRKNGTWVAE